MSTPRVDLNPPPVPAASPIEPPVVEPAADVPKVAVIAVAGVLAILLTLAAYFSDRSGVIDEIGLYNPTYMAVHYGKMTYPVHGYFDNMVVHPPIHYEAVAILMRLGLSLYYAEATPALLMLFLCIWLIASGPFPGAIKIGLFYGLWMSIAVFSARGVELFGMRPENHLGAAWIAGLVALESGRLRKWDPKLLAAGAFFLTYASGVHYYAGLGFLGAAVYMVWAVRSLGFGAARKPLLAVIAGGLAFGIPYLLLFFFPQRDAVLALIHSTQGGGSILENIRAHAAEYRSDLPLANFWLSLPFSTAIPMVLLSTPVLLAMRSTRGLALAALPLQLFVLLFAWHKHTYYYIHEVALYGAAAAAGMLTLAVKYTPRLRWRAAQGVVWAFVAMLLAFGWWQLHKWHGAGNALMLSAEPRLHEAEIARAATREILGSHARVASRIGAWYASGGEFWHNSSEVYQRPFTRPEAEAYFARFDAIAENAHMSDATYNPQHKSVLSWYLEGALQVRGFFFAHENSELSCLLLQTPRAGSPGGFALKGTELYRFAPDERGDYEFDVVTAPVGPAADDLLEGVENRHTLYLPQANPAETQQVLVLTLSPADKAPSARRLLAGSRVIQRTRGRLSPVDKRQLVDRLRRTDPPMRFFANLGDVPPPALPATSAGLAVR